MIVYEVSIVYHGLWCLNNIYITSTLIQSFENFVTRKLSYCDDSIYSTYTAYRLAQTEFLTLFAFTKYIMH